MRKRYENYIFEVKYPILDIGGGDGSFLESQKIEQATIIEGGKYKYGKYKYIHADITKKLPKLNQKFKTIFIMEVLEHLKNPLHLLSQVYDILDDDGVCYIAIPYTEISPKHHHVCRWKLKEIGNQLSKLGFVSRIIQKRRRFKGLGFFLPHCWLVLAIKKRRVNSNQKNIENYNLEI
ncbi:MAG: methyltransferase domain-containing protein [archaeon]